MNNLGKRKILYFFVQSFCDACTEAKPIVEKFRMEHPEFIVLILNPNLREWNVDKYRPRSTPSYAFVDESGELMSKHEGVLTYSQLEKAAKATSKKRKDA